MITRLILVLPQEEEILMVETDAREEHLGAVFIWEQ